VGCFFDGEGKCYNIKAGCAYGVDACNVAPEGILLIFIVIFYIFL
jgi:hypothetical protein